MKKLMFALVAAGAAAVMAADAIESANAVGFAKCPVDSDTGMCSIGIAFKNINGGDFEIADTLFGQPLFPDDQIYVWNFENGDWDMYQYGGTENGWAAFLSDGSEAYELRSIPALAKGQGFYYLPADYETSAIPAGEVEGSGEKQLVMTTEDGSEPAYEFVNPFPIDTKFGDFERFLQPDDQLYIWNTLNGDWDMYVYGGEGMGWSTFFSDGTDGVINEDAVPGYTETTLLEANRAAWVLPAWNWDMEFPQSRIFTAVLNY